VDLTDTVMAESAENDHTEGEEKHGTGDRPTTLFSLRAVVGGGNAPPQLALARRLTERGHRVRVLAPRALQAAIDAARCVFVPFHAVPEHDSSSVRDDLAKDWEARTPKMSRRRSRRNART